MKKFGKKCSISGAEELILIGCVRWPGRLPEQWSSMHDHTVKFYSGKINLEARYRKSIGDKVRKFR